MKLFITIALLASTLAPSAFASEWEKVACKYSRKRIPDDDTGTWCRHFYTCVDQGKRAFILYSEGSMDRFCCTSANVNCTPTYNGD